MQLPASVLQLPGRYGVHYRSQVRSFVGDPLPWSSRKARLDRSALYDGSFHWWKKSVCSPVLQFLRVSICRTHTAVFKRKTLGVSSGPRPLWTFPLWAKQDSWKYGSDEGGREEDGQTELESDLCAEPCTDIPSAGITVHHGNLSYASHSRGNTDASFRQPIE